MGLPDLLHPTSRHGAAMPGPRNSGNPFYVPCDARTICNMDEAQLMRRSRDCIWARELQPGLRPGFFFFSLTPGPSPFSSTKITPAFSRAVRIAAIASAETDRRARSKSTTVDNPSDADLASFGCVQSNSARAARDCAGVISTFSVDRDVCEAYQHILLIASRDLR